MKLSLNIFVSIIVIFAVPNAMALTQQEYCTELVNKTTAGVLLYKESGATEPQVRNMFSQAVQEMRVESPGAPAFFGMPGYFDLVESGMNIVVSTVYMPVNLSNEARKKVVQELCFGPRISKYFQK